VNILIGRLTLEAFKHDIIIGGAGVTMIVLAVAAVIALTYFKRWKWLWKEWITTSDHKKIGKMYIAVAVLMLFKGLVEALLMRTQQALSSGASNGIVDSHHFQQLFTAHGTTMIFFVAMGLFFGIINLILPLQIGSRDVAFPFLNSMSFWLYTTGALLISISLIIGDFAATGWLAYPPLSELAYSPGVGVDYWIWSIQIAGIGSLLSGVNFLTTIFKMRAKGMTLMKMPIFVWTVIGSMVLIVFAFPILTATLLMLTLDRTMGMHFFTAVGGGNPMMYVNLIWAWGHPEVYILILPAFGVFSEVVATYSRKRLFGYTSMVWAIIAITILSFTVWLHHFFTMGAGANVNAFFGVMTMVISIPTGVKIFNWLFTMYKGRINQSTPILWFLGFVLTFTIGGVAGVLMAVPAIDFQVHNSLFLVAHFHTMIIGGVVFGYFAGINYWFPKMFGFKLHEKLGRYAFWCWVIGFTFAFVPLYILGIMGATRRLDHYDASMGWQGLFAVAGIGLLIILAGVFFQIVQIVVSIVQRKKNMDVSGDPWDGRTLEWSIPSPAPVYNFAILPEVTERDDFWNTKQNNIKKSTNYTDILMPKNSGKGFVIAMLAFAFGFGAIWHMVWLVVVSMIGIIIVVLTRVMEEDTEYTITADEVRRIEEGRNAHA
jgi:cytochrome o ubiquinol oxidase subunit 1